MRPTYTILYATDMLESLGFWRHILAAEPVENTADFALFVLPGDQKFGLWRRDTVQPPVTAAPGGMELCVSVEDRDMVDATVAGWKARGIPLVHGPEELDFGYAATATDPDGHRLRVFAPAAR